MDEQKNPVFKKTRLAKREAKKAPKFNTLQGYIIVFFVIAVLLLGISWFFQHRLETNNEQFQNIIDDQKTTLSTNSEIIEKLQEEYLVALDARGAAESELETVAAERDALAAQNEQNTAVLESANHVISAYLNYRNSRYSDAREHLASADPEQLGDDARQLYNILYSLLY